MTLQDAFAQLIQIPGWYKPSGILKQNASRDKKKFQDGELPEKRMRTYLVAAGWECVQPEFWKFKIDDYGSKK